MSDACPNCGAPVDHHLSTDEYIQHTVYQCGRGHWKEPAMCEYAAGLRAAYEREKQARLRLSEQNADLKAERDAWMQQCNKAKRQRDHYRNIVQAIISALDTWKQPLLNPDGVDQSEATIRLIANDAREALEDTTT